MLHLRPTLQSTIEGEAAMFDLLATVILLTRHLLPATHPLARTHLTQISIQVTQRTIPQSGQEERLFGAISITAWTFS
jgi:hypothetical protein